MLAEIYVEALLVNEELADQVWEAWDKGEIDDRVACIAWWFVANHAAGIVDNTIDTAKPTNPP